MLLTREPIFSMKLSKRPRMETSSHSLLWCRVLSGTTLYVQNRIHTLPEEDQSQLNAVYDGMAQRATNTYNEHCRGEFAAESIRNYIVNSEINSHLFDRPSSARRMPLSREELLEADETPIIIAPSGMLSGGFSPTYLLEFTQRYDEVTPYHPLWVPGRRNTWPPIRGCFERKSR